MTKKEILKMKAALLFITSRFEDGIDFLKLFKILYFANKYHLKDYLRPVINDNFIAMQNGPVPSYLYDVLKGRIDDQYLSHAYSKEEYVIFAKEECDMDYLSESDIECLNRSIEENKDLGFRALSDKSHDEAYHNTVKDKPMSLEDIAKAAGLNEDSISYMMEGINFFKPYMNGIKSGSLS